MLRRFSAKLSSSMSKKDKKNKLSGSVTDHSHSKPPSTVVEDAQQLHEPEVDDTTFRLTDKIVYDFIWGYMEEFTEVAQEDTFDRTRWEEFWKKNHAKDYLLIRPSGNPLDLNGLIAMFEDGDIKDFSDTMIAVESVKILGGGQVAVMVFKSEQVFKYKGIQEEDFATWTVVIVPEDDRPKITNIHRSSGKRIDSSS